MKPQKTLVRNLRRTRELSLDLVAHDTGINVSTLSRGERGLISFTSDQKKVLAKYFKCNEDDLQRDPAKVAA